MKFIKDILTVKFGHDGGSDTTGVFGTVFYIFAAIMFLAGSSIALEKDKCTIERVVQLHPAYIVSCAIMGKTLPTFEIGGKDQ